jgi:hypothetical protein
VRTAAAKAAQLAQGRERFAALVDRLEELWGTGSPVEIAAELGYKRPSDLRRRLCRNGRHDLAERLRVAEARFADLVEDLEWVAGRSVREKALAVGYSNPASLARRLDRWGRRDLARQFWNLDHQARGRKPAEVQRTSGAEDTVLSA